MFPQQNLDGITSIILNPKLELEEWMKLSIESMTIIMNPHLKSPSYKKIIIRGELFPMLFSLSSVFGMRFCDMKQLYFEPCPWPILMKKICTSQGCQSKGLLGQQYPRLVKLMKFKKIVSRGLVYTGIMLLLLLLLLWWWWWFIWTFATYFLTSLVFGWDMYLRPWSYIRPPGCHWCRKSAPAVEGSNIRVMFVAYVKVTEV